MASNNKKFANPLQDKVILLTGGTGSFGQKFVELALRYNPQVIRIYSRGEHRQLEMESKFADNHLRFLIGDVRDSCRLSRAMYGVNIVVHAAALKHVPVAEYNPLEAIKTNIYGSANVIEAAIDNEVEKVIAISSDKAVHPVNLYGMAKGCMEKLMIQANVYSRRTEKVVAGDKILKVDRLPRFSSVRYGNVIGSQGSVIPLWLQQRKSGKITVTHEEMTRFWITLEVGAQFVIDCIGRMRGGEVFVPKLPSMRLVDLANAIAPDAKREFIGIRPGEKLHEILITEEEAKHTKEFESYYVIEPEFPFWTEEPYEGGKPLPEGFRYDSQTNPCSMTLDYSSLTGT